MDDIILCAKVCVDCFPNDPENIKNGEPKMVGFVFDVRRNEAEEMMAFIEEKLKEYQIPYQEVYVYCSVGLPLVYVYDKEKIADKIKRLAPLYIEEGKQKRKQK